MLNSDFTKVWNAEVVARWPQWALKRTPIDVSDWYEAFRPYSPDSLSKAIKQYRVEYDDLPKIPVIVKMCRTIQYPPKPKIDSVRPSVPVMTEQDWERTIEYYKWISQQNDDTNLYFRSILYKKCPTYKNYEPLGEDIAKFFQKKNILDVMVGKVAPAAVNIDQPESHKVVTANTADIPTSAGFFSDEEIEQFDKEDGIKF